ncbi:hypothetical protein CBM2599_B50074 [Cupriavidus taiwanensis]|uniref:Uncharacterized protein n=1 Tax=Cupriavidus taiwanensis TaxID=164546 RepID=A0A976FXT2_9BURK|nr:hypothetical protein CBM2600_B10915 [Cupriavidus taiwanensis]SOY96053.1 hypothetical protein CBM2599_B50074 [Cupriavidus taiwanensis]SPD66466.1 protein of unknown function [Cupriavidus taiwanensis]
MSPACNLLKGILDSRRSRCNGCVSRCLVRTCRRDLAPMLAYRHTQRVSILGGIVRGPRLAARSVFVAKSGNATHGLHPYHRQPPPRLCRPAHAAGQGQPGALR